MEGGGGGGRAATIGFKRINAIDGREGLRRGLREEIKVEE
jgi:hypothetical protein